MRKLSITLGMCALLGGCNEAPAAEEILPGKWEISIGITQFDVPGATPEQAELLKSLAGEMSSQQECIAENDRKFDPSELAKAFEQGDNCQTGEFTVSEGTIAGSMSCTQPDASTSEFAVTGSVQPENFSMSVDMEMVQASIPGGRANVTMQVVGTRLGECDVQ